VPAAVKANGSESTKTNATSGQVGDRLGGGSYGCVWEATLLDTGISAVVKVLLRAVLPACLARSPRSLGGWNTQLFANMGQHETELMPAVPGLRQVVWPDPDLDGPEACARSPPSKARPAAHSFRKRRRPLLSIPCVRINTRCFYEACPRLWSCCLPYS